MRFDARCHETRRLGLSQQRTISTTHIEQMQLGSWFRTVALQLCR